MQNLAHCRERIAELEESERHLNRTQIELRGREEQCVRIANRLSIFDRAVLAVTSTTHLASGLQKLSDVVKCLLPHDRVSVTMADSSGQTMTVYATAGLTGTLVEGFVIPAAGSNVGQQVVKDGVPLVERDIECEADFVEKYRLLELGIRSCVSVPLWQGDKCAGSLNFGSQRIGRYGLCEVTLVQELADHVAAPIIAAKHLQEMLHLSTASRPAGRRQPAGDKVPGGIRVLIVDDYEVLRWGIRSMLERVDDVIVAGEAEDGESAIEMVRTLVPDVLLLDIRMPKLNGVATLRRLRELGLQTRTILLSAYAKDEYIFEGLRAGARGYLLKEVGRDDLVHAIRTVYRGGSSLQPVIADRLIKRLALEEHPCLTEREQEVLQLLALGARNKGMARELRVSINTIKYHIDNIYKKLGVGTRTKAVREARERGLLDM